MCTCLKIKNKDTYFGRNMDITHSFNEKVIITPRNYALHFKNEKSIKNHYAFIGIGTIINNYPLYAEATNEHGLAIAGLNFPSNCHYYDGVSTKLNLAPYEFILYLLGTCKNISEVNHKLKDINIVNIDFSYDIKLTPLHFMISDSNESIVIETLKDGMKIYHNPFEVLTNNPPFNYHQENIKNYLNIHNKNMVNNINPSLNLKHYSFGGGAIGLPGDYSSASRFIRIYFNKTFLLLDKDNNDVIQFFNCLDSVKITKGVVLTDFGYEYTRYSSCININKGILYYKTYDNPNIYFVEMFKENLTNTTLIYYNMNYESIFKRQN